MLLSLIYQTRASFFWSTKYKQRKINIARDLCDSEPGYLRPKRDDSYVRYLRWFGLVLFDEFEGVKPCKFVVVVSIGQKAKTNKKTKERKKADGKEKFSGVRWLGNSNKVAIKFSWKAIASVFGLMVFLHRQQHTWWNGWEIKQCGRF